MRRIGLLGVAALLLLPLGGVPYRPLPLDAPRAATEPLTGIVFQGGARLAQVDPATLTASRTSESAASYVGGWIRSPDGSLLALGLAVGGSGNRSPTSFVLRFVSPSTLEWRPGAVRLGGYFRTGLWPSAGTVLAVVGDGSSFSVETVDVAAQKVVRRRALAGAVASAQRSASGLVLLMQPAATIGPARIVTVGADASLRTVRLRDVLAGSSWKRAAGGDMIGRVRRPGLAVDAEGGTAYVVDAGGLVAAVDLRTLAVDYHRPSRSLASRISGWLTPTAEAKGLNGPTRSAEWLGDGLIAIVGSDQSAVSKKGGRFVASGRPAGLTILDTRDWRVHTIDPRADAATVADGMMLATGGSWRSSATSSTSSGEGLAAFGADGSLRWRVDEGARRWLASAYGSLAVVGRAAGGAYDVVDIRTGALLRAGVPGPFPQLLLGAGS